MVFCKYTKEVIFVKFLKFIEPVAIFVGVAFVAFLVCILISGFLNIVITLGYIAIYSRKVNMGKMSVKVFEDRLKQIDRFFSVPFAIMLVFIYIVMHPWVLREIKLSKVLSRTFWKDLRGLWKGWK